MFFADQEYQCGTILVSLLNQKKVKSKLHSNLERNEIQVFSYVFYLINFLCFLILFFIWAPPKGTQGFMTGSALRNHFWWYSRLTLKWCWRLNPGSLCIRQYLDSCGIFLAPIIHIFVFSGCEILVNIS